MEASELSKVVDSYTRAVETRDIVARLDRICSREGKKMNRDILRRVGELESVSNPARPPQVFRFIGDPEGAARCSGKSRGPRYFPHHRFHRRHARPHEPRTG